MDNVPSTALGGCRWIRYLRVLFQRIRGIGCKLWASFLKPVAPRHLVRVPRSPVLQLGSPVAIGLQGLTRPGCSETIHHEVFREVGSSSTLLLPNPDLEPRSTVAPRLEQPPSLVSEPKNSEVLPTTEPNRSLIHDPLPEPKNSEGLPETEPNRSLIHDPLPEPVLHASVPTIPPGFEKVWAARTKTPNSQTDVNLRTISPKEMRDCDFPIGPSFEERWVSSHSESTSSDVVSEPEMIHDAIRLARRGAVVSGAEVEQAMFTKHFSRFSESSDSDSLSNPEGTRALFYATGAPIASSNEVPPGRHQTETSYSYSDHTTDSEVLSDPEKPSFHSAVKESTTAGENSSTGVLASEEVKLRGNSANDLGAVVSRQLNPNAKEFIPGTLSSSRLPVRSGQEPDAQRKPIKLDAEQLTSFSTEGKAHSPFLAPNHSALDLGTALRLNYERAGQWTKWTGSNFVPRSHSEVVWGPGHKKPSAGTSGLVQDLKFSFGTKSSPPPTRKPSTGVSEPVHNLKLHNSRNKSACSPTRKPSTGTSRPVQDFRLTSGNKGAVTSWQKKERRQGDRPFYYSSSPVRTLQSDK